MDGSFIVWLLCIHVLDPINSLPGELTTVSSSNTNRNRTTEKNQGLSDVGQWKGPEVWVIVVVVISAIFLALAIAFGIRFVCIKDKEPLEIKARAKSLEAEEDRKNKS